MRSSLHRLVASRPAVWGWTLQLRTRVCRTSNWIRANPAYACVAIVVPLAAIALVASAVPLDLLPMSIHWLHERRFVVGLATALYFTLSIHRHRAILRSEREHSWLISAPQSSGQLQFVSVLRITLSAILRWLTIVLVIWLVSSLSRAAGASEIVLALSIGTALGALAGTLLRIPHAAEATAGSRYILKPASRAVDAVSLVGLAYWPIAKALAWHRPENSRWLFIAAALSVPMGSSAFLGIVILAIWSIGSYLIALARWFPSVVREAALWLRPTPVSFPCFAWALMRRMLLHQCIGAALFGVVLLMIGAHIALAIHAACLWFSLVLLITTISARQCFLAQASVLRIWIAALIVLAVELRERGWGIALATIVGLIHVRRVSHARS